MKTIVTGGAGFIGSHVVDEYVSAGHHVIVVDNLVTGKVDNVNSNAIFHEMDFCSQDFRQLVLKTQPDVVNHHAGQTLIHVSTRDPILDAEVNVLGMIGLLQTCVEAGVRKVVFASSAGVYGQAARLPITEETPFSPENPYAITKVACEHYLRYFSKDAGLCYTVLRYGNVFGPRDQVGSDHVITVFASHLLRGVGPVIHWDGSQAKDFVFAKDVAVANRLALDAGDNQAFNVASGVPITVNEIYGHVTDMLGVHVEPAYGPKRRGDVREAYFDVSKSRRVLGWHPHTSFSEALSVTLDWFRGNLRPDYSSNK